MHKSSTSFAEQVALPDIYEAPVITTYTEAELLAALGPAHAGSPIGDGLMNELLGIPEEPEW
jgi:hypothetical protein